MAIESTAPDTISPPAEVDIRSAPTRLSARKAGRLPSRKVLAITGAVAVILASAVGSRLWQAANLPQGVTASGFVEADEVVIGAEVAARVVELPLHVGDTVRVGDIVARLDDSLVQIQLRQADPIMLRQLEIQAQKYVLRAPISGIVSREVTRLGEVAAPGQAVIAVAQPDRLDVNLFVLQADLGKVQVGQTVDLSSDSFPGRTFSGTVKSINQRAEFTPRNVQTQRDRLNLVYRVQVGVDNPDGALKAGMPVDALFLRTAANP
jgi:multidrug resistance efflux pump